MISPPSVDSFAFTTVESSTPSSGPIWTAPAGLTHAATVPRLVDPSPLPPCPTERPISTMCSAHGQHYPMHSDDRTVTLGMRGGIALSITHTSPSMWVNLDYPVLPTILDSSFCPYSWPGDWPVTSSVGQKLHFVQEEESSIFAPFPTAISPSCMASALPASDPFAVGADIKADVYNVSSQPASPYVSAHFSTPTVSSTKSLADTPSSDAPSELLRTITMCVRNPGLAPPPPSRLACSPVLVQDRAFGKLSPSAQGVIALLVTVEPKESHNATYDASHVRRSPNRFIIFRSWACEVQRRFGLLRGDGRSICWKTTELWSQVDADVKEIFEEVANLARLRHHERFQGYKYEPGSREVAKQLSRRKRQKGAANSHVRQEQSIYQLLFCGRPAEVKPAGESGCL